MGDWYKFLQIKAIKGSQLKFQKRMKYIVMEIREKNKNCGRYNDVPQEIWKCQAKVSFTYKWQQPIEEKRVN